MSDRSRPARYRTVAGFVASALAASAGVLAFGSATAQAAAPPPQPGTYVPITAANLLDTGAAVGVPTRTPVPAHGTVTVQIAGHGGIPATNVAAVAMTVAATSTGSGYVTVYPAGTTRPGAASLSFPAGRATSNLAYAKLGTNGSINLYNGTSGTSRLYVNVSGYFVGGTATDAATYVPLQPANVLDTGTGVGTGGHIAAVPAHGTVSVTVGGNGGVPATGAASAVLNVGVVSGGSGGFLTSYAAGQARPGAASVDFAANAVTSTLVTVQLSAAGSATFYNGSNAGIRIEANVFGYYRGGTAAVPGSFVQVTPTNLYDSSIDGALIPAHGTVNPAAVSTPSRAKAWTDGRSALVVSVGVAYPGASGYLVAYSAQASRPPASNLAFSTGQMTLNGAAISVTDQGDINLYNGSAGAIRAVVNLFGYYLDGPVSPMHWTGGSTLDQNGEMTSVSCTSATTCYAVDEAGNILTRDSGTWSPKLIDATNPLQWVSCVPTECVAVDDNGGARTLSSSWTERKVADANPKAVLVGVSCVSAQFCMAVGTNGDAVSYDGKVWATPVVVKSGAVLTSVSCATTTFCAATDNLGGVYTYNGTSWSARTATQSAPEPVVIPEIWCTSSTFCAMADDAGVWTFDGTHWTVANSHLTGQATTVMCTGPTFCVAVATGDEAVTFDGTQWSVPTHLVSGIAMPEVNDRPESVYCTSTTSCLLVNDQSAWIGS